MKASWADRPSANPVLKGLAIALAVAILMIVLTVIAVLSPVWILLDFILKRYSRRGFIVQTETGLSLKFDTGAFLP